MRAPSLRRACAVLVAGAALCAPLLALPARAGGGSGRPVAPPPPPPPAPIPLAGLGREAVTITTSDGLSIAATYSQGGVVPPAPGGPALVLVHEEGPSRLAYAALVDRLDAHRVPWLAIDLRGHGKSREQGGKDLGPLALARDPATYAGAADDTYAALRWLVDVRKHDPKAIGLLGAGLGASAVIRVAHLHKGEMAAVMLLTPALDLPGYDTVADAHDIDGYMDFEILASVEDMNRLDKRGPRRLIYSVRPTGTRRRARRSTSASSSGAASRPASARSPRPTSTPRRCSARSRTSTPGSPRGGRAASARSRTPSSTTGRSTGRATTPTRGGTRASPSRRAKAPRPARCAGAGA
jgi:pimeloyl-ACP methyl ester carboxylesterase